MAFYGIDPILVADVVLWPARSIIKQSYDARERKNDTNLPHHLGYGNLNGDGFGIGWFPSMAAPRHPESSDPCVFTSITPAWNNENLNRLATKIESRMVFAHVRAAYPGMPVSEQNCHPFQWGRYLFMHNGVVAGFMQLRRHLLALLSDEAYNAVQSFHSDSAVCFALFLNRLPDVHAPQSAGVILKAVEETITLIRQLQRQHGVGGNSLLNFCVSDGVNLVATRYASNPDDEPASLYYAEGSAYERSTEGAGEASAMASAAAAASDPGGERAANSAASNAVTGEGDYHLDYSELGTRVCLIASEPVTSSATDWVEVPRNTALVVCPETDGLLCVLRSPLIEGGDHPRRAEVLRCLEAASMQQIGGLLATNAGEKAVQQTTQLQHHVCDHPHHQRSLSFPHPIPETSAAATPRVGQFHEALGGCRTVNGLLRKTVAGGGYDSNMVTPSRDVRAIASRCMRPPSAEPSFTTNLSAFPSEATFATSQAGGMSDDDNISGSTQYGSQTPPRTAHVREETDSAAIADSQKLSSGDQKRRRTRLSSALGQKAAGVLEDDADFAGAAAANPVPHVLTGHSGAVMALSAQHDLLFSGATDCSIRVWSLVSDSCVAVLRGHRDPIRALTVCGPYLASLGAKTLRLWVLSSDFRCAAVLAVADVRGNAKAIAAPCFLNPCGSPEDAAGMIGTGSDVLPDQTRGDDDPPLEPQLNGSHQLLSAHKKERWLYVGSQDCRVRGFKVPVVPSSDSDHPSLQKNCLNGNGIISKLSDQPYIPTSILPADSPRCMGPPDRISSHVPPAAAPAAISSDANGHAGAVTSLALSSTHLFSASADATIRVWQLPDLQYVRTLRGHRGSVLALHVAGGLLLSGGRDGLVRAWDCGTLVCRRTLAGHKADILAITSIGIATVIAPLLGAWGSIPNGGNGALAEYADMTSPKVPLSSTMADTELGSGSGSAEHSSQQQHGKQPLLYASASVDGTIRVWDALGLTCLRVFEVPGRVPVTACALTETHVAAGLPDGVIRLYGIDDLFASAAALVLGVDMNGAEEDTRRQSTSVGNETTTRMEEERASLGEDGASMLPSKRHRIGAHKLPVGGEPNNAVTALPPVSRTTTTASLEREMERALRAFVRIRSISANPLRSEECFRGAKFLHRLLESLGAEVKLVQPLEGKSPLVMARLGRCPDRPTVTFYGHYDVQPALEPEWKTSPWELTSVDGHLYGRGVSDNKGPVLAFIYAVKELVGKPGSQLPVNVAFLIEGEEENGSMGFHEAVSSNLDWYEGTELVLISNTLWVGERVPCLTYGMRGMISASIEVTGPTRDLHSGNEGGVFSEPLADLTKVLSSLVDARATILVPGFYDDIRPGMLDAAMTGLAAHSDEFSLEGYREQIGVRSLAAGASEWDLLSARWCQPSLSVVDVRVGDAAGSVEWSGGRHYRFGPTRFSVIPRAAVGQVAIRFVPDQSPERLIELLRAHVKHEFAKLRSGNQVDVRVHSIGDWWESDAAAPLSKLAARVVGEEWGAKPLLVREGGTMPVARKLEKMLDAPVLMLPMGQASDNCHLANERIARINLVRGKNVVERLLRELPKAKQARD